MKESDANKKLNRKIQALSLALSTVHTVHRLLASSLNFDELLPRMARLCLQVLRSEQCAIFLLDSRRENLLRRASVKARERRRKEGIRKIPVGNGIEGKVARTGNPCFKKNHLCVPLMDEDVLGIISIRGKQGKEPYSIEDREILTTLAEQAVVAFKNARLYEEQEELTMDLVRSLAGILASKSPMRIRSTERLVALALGTAAELHLAHEEKKILHYAVLLHDAGIITVPEHILTKPTKLTGPEYRLIQRIPVTSARFVRPIRFLEPVLPIILHHTERYDGKGYPRGLKGDEIPLGARVLAVVKSFDAMMTPRPYRQKIGLRKALAELKRQQGKQFDPHIIQAVLEFSRKKTFQKILRK